ncbi:dephospho-CoA kinase [Zobellia galactanivorans]|uniref:Dephospho-CoA kinase n=1 Tax=Zobellia galactanivorans (strain DSM 12802 / CCUG 47099 / CIP 106680 / NCIMB 13871 / Dsij) TaxID=63186 RepID=G0L4T7_ZOBGA|nr:dephospho-CoA kinase [Zobellia galactanivorans]MBU3027077.1 dephospho-CoA kinase [Zobellia galactanivorans]MDO6807993.1 dephospho-CoA kinase [Zobellia galactanivorans]CAZ98895.1 Dephospho-CoA kinase [Zobellia galactanivorans]
MRIVGLTGGIGSGKTTVAKMFEELGVPVYNSDTRAKELMQSSQDLVLAIKELLGEEAYREDGVLDRGFVSRQVFDNKALLNELNAIVHPAVRKDFIHWADEQTADYVIQEAAIIFEIGTQDFYDCIILVVAPKETRIERVVQRDAGTTVKSVEARMKNQWEDDRKIEASDYVIENTNLEQTKVQVLDIHRDLLNKI